MFNAPYKNELIIIIIIYLGSSKEMQPEALMLHEAMLHMLLRFLHRKHHKFLLLNIYKSVMTVISECNPA